MMDISRKTKEYKISMFGLFRFSFMLDGLDSAPCGTGCPAF